MTKSGWNAMKITKNGVGICFCWSNPLSTWHLVGSGWCTQIFQNPTQWSWCQFQWPLYPLPAGVAGNISSERRHVTYEVKNRKKNVKFKIWLWIKCASQFSNPHSPGGSGSTICVPHRILQYRELKKRHIL